MSSAAAGAGAWSSGLFDCFADGGLCCMTFFCPCITFGRTAEMVDKGSTSCWASGALYVCLCWFTGCQWIYSCTYRAKLRAQYVLPESPCCDCCVHFCCAPCALCQEYRELTARGLDPDIGWQLNVERGNAPGVQMMGR